MQSKEINRLHGNMHCDITNAVKDKKTSKHEFAERIFLIAIATMLMLLIIFTLKNIHELEGTGRVINYAGIVRGGTQRLIKLEIVKKPNDELLQNLNIILYGLKNGGSTYALQKLDDNEYQAELDKLINMWDELKNTIFMLRKSSYEQTNIIDLSEKYFFQADVVVAKAEEYSKRITDTLAQLERALSILLFVCAVLIVRRFILMFLIIRKSHDLSKKVYLDMQTSLPNKNQVEEILASKNLVKKETTCMMFDLNDLKLVNDTKGHITGDVMISEFASMLQKVVGKNNFVGRYGGDEFVVVLYQSKKNEGASLINKLKNLCEQFNAQNKDFTLSFAAGYAHASNFSPCTLKTLLEHADSNMYQNKRNMKNARL